MKWNSLRLRLIVGGVVAILVALTLAGGGLSLLVGRHVSRAIAADLDLYLTQLLAGLNLDAEGRLAMGREPSDPRFAAPLSGLYWQIGDDRGQMLRSRSLWDTTLTVPDDEPKAGEVHHHRTLGPAGARVMIAERQVSLTAAGRPVKVRLVVATDLTRVRSAVADFAKDMAVALAVLAAVLALATAVQVALGLRPLQAIRRGIAEIRSGLRHRLAPAAPIEVGPLVDEVNALLDAQEAEIERSRGRAADLAHGLKTPLAALSADAARLRERGQAEIARDIEAVAEAMSRYVDRELARARVYRGAGRKAGLSTELAPLVRALVETLGRTPAGTGIAFETSIAAEARLPFDRTDLAEILGNLIDNASRHARRVVRVSLQGTEAVPCIVIEDDGPGLAPEAIPTVLARGGRLDERSGGAGLGLAIVQDVLDVYGWRLSLGASPLGGLRAAIAPVPKMPPP